MYVFYAIVYLVRSVCAELYGASFDGEFMGTFNPDNCGLRLIPSSAIEEWISSFNSVDPNITKLLHVSSAKLYEKSVSPTEDQFLLVLGNEDLVLED